jgi:hypothetical protein
LCEILYYVLIICIQWQVGKMLCLSYDRPMLNSFFEIAVKARHQNENLSFDKFLNFYKTAQEEFLLNTSPASTNLFTQNFFAHDCQETLISSGVTHCHNTFTILNAVTQSFESNHPIICDDFLMWKMLQNKFADNRSYDAFKKIYRLFENPSVTNILEFLNHPLILRGAKNLELELLVLTDELKNIQALLDLLPDSLRKILMQKFSSFTNFYEQLIAILPLEIVNKLHQFQCLITFIESDNNLEWADGLVMLAFAQANIKWGLENALKFQPQEVVLCITQPLIPKLLSANAQKIFPEKLQNWQNNHDLCVFTNLIPKTHNHPLLIPDYKTASIFINESKISRTYAKPKLEFRQLKISATGFQQLMQDPYGFYARYILGLKNLNRILTRAKPKDFGILAHELIERSINFKEFNIEEFSGIHPLWRKKIKRILDWVKIQLHDLKAINIICEKTVSSDLKMGEKFFTMQARLDALIKSPSGNLMINFKTGTPPPKADVICGYSSQLAIEMFLARNFLKSDCQGEFWHLKGTQPPGQIHNVPISQAFLETNISKIIEHYLCTESIFLACPWPARTVAYNYYKHLERIE